MLNLIAKRLYFSAVRESQDQEPKKQKHHWNMFCGNVVFLQYVGLAAANTNSSCFSIQQICNDLCQALFQNP